MTAIAVLNIAVAGLAIVWIYFEVRQGVQQRPEAQSADGGSITVLRAAYVAGVIGALTAQKFVLSLAISADAPGVWLELPLLICGVAIRLWSFRTLGRYFTFTVKTSDDQPVISGGPYRFVRHPGYLGLVLAIAGVSLTMRNWASCGILLVTIVPALMYRISVEERALIRDLGGRYEAFAKDRKRLIPFVW